MVARERTVGKAAFGIAAAGLTAETFPTMGNLAFARGTVLIVEVALLFVAEHLVRFVYFLELGLIATRIGVMLTSQLAKGLLDLVLCCVPWNA